MIDKICMSIAYVSLLIYGAADAGNTGDESSIDQEKQTEISEKTSNSAKAADIGVQKNDEVNKRQIKVLKWRIEILQKRIKMLEKRLKESNGKNSALALSNSINNKKIEGMQRKIQLLVSEIKSLRKQQTTKLDSNMPSLPTGRTIEPNQQNLPPVPKEKE